MSSKQSAVVLVFVTSMITLFTGDRIPVAGISAVQLLWVNLIMDTLAALALATDPPTPSLLNRKPSKRSDPILNPDMIKMIIGQAIYQIVVCLVVYLLGPGWRGPADLSYKDLLYLRSAYMFNTFVFCQIFNEVNARSITKGEPIVYLPPDRVHV
jgi:Ca2+-transporting ATPase